MITAAAATMMPVNIKRPPSPLSSRLSHAREKMTTMVATFITSRHFRQLSSSAPTIFRTLSRAFYEFRAARSNAEEAALSARQLRPAESE